MSRDSSPTRPRILDAARDLLEARGTAEVRMSDIAKAAGISRQALYLHFPNRAELLMATARRLDEVHEISARVEERMMGRRGLARLDGLIEVWGGYIPRIHGVGRALMAIMEADEGARAAWEDRMEAVRGLCASAVASLAEEGELAGDLEREEAIDLLLALLSVRTWEMLTRARGWSQEGYLRHMRRAARRMLTDGG